MKNISTPFSVVIMIAALILLAESIYLIFNLIQNIFIGMTFIAFSIIVIALILEYALYNTNKKEVNQNVSN